MSGSANPNDPPHYREVLVLVELAERSYAETAMICHCELNTVRSRLFRARGLLAQWVAQSEAPSEALPDAARVPAQTGAAEATANARRKR